MLDNSNTGSSFLSEEFINEVAAAYGSKYDDRERNDRSRHLGLGELAQKFGTSKVRIRRILITKGLYSTSITREVARLADMNCSMNEICEVMKLKPASVWAALPYGKGIYNIDPKTPLGERVDRSRHRKAAVIEMKKCLQEKDMKGTDNISSCTEALMECLILFQGYRFKTIGRNGKDGVSFTYSIKRSSCTGELTKELLIDRKEHSKTITRSKFTVPGS